MTLYQLECFIQVADQLSFVRAAQMMCISQPAITYQIQSLEKEMDVKLFERNTRHCRLTPAGQSFYHDAVQLFSFYRQSVQKTQEIHRASKLHLRLGIRKLFDYDRLVELVEQFYSKHPQANIDILAQNEGNPLDDLRTGKIDVGFFYSCEHDECLDIEFSPLYELNYYVLMKAENPLAKKKSLNLSDLKGVPVVTAGANTNFLSAIQSPLITEIIKSGADISNAASSFESAMIMVRAEKAVLILPMLNSAEIQGMIKVPLVGCQKIQMEIGWMKKDKRSEVPEIIEFARNLYPCK